MMIGRNPAGGTNHFRARKSGGYVWDITANAGAGGWVIWSDGAFINFRIAATPTGDGWYEAAAPAGTEWYNLCITGASLAASPSVATGTIEATPTLTGTGDGDIPVNHNFGGTDALRIDDGTNPVDNAKIEAFLSTDTALTHAIAWTFTGPDGRWVAPLMLNAGSYTFVVSKPGSIVAFQFTREVA